MTTLHGSRSESFPREMAGKAEREHMLLLHGFGEERKA